MHNQHIKEILEHVDISCRATEMSIIAQTEEKCIGNLVPAVDIRTNQINKES